jgi:hypothetical protein
LDVSPWADSYWPTYKGGTAFRYADPGFPESKDWMQNSAYVNNYPASVIVMTADSNLINKLSPAEKYDLLVGDMSWTLTQYAWNEGFKGYSRDGFVASWTGICHGWAGAAHMLVPVTQKPITLVSSVGIPVTFYPSDIKALQSMLYANASPPTRFVGSRCKLANPPTNPGGRVIDPGCFDTNPATFHVAITNQLGIHRRSFVIDSTFDAEVWNFSLVSYKYRYFNPQTMEPSNDLRYSIVPIEKFRIDKLKSFRDSKTKYVVGIIMDATHVNAIAPNRGPQTESPTKTLRYYYDLEMDENNLILGGEWYASSHPDFIWTHAKESKALSLADRNIDVGDWQPGSPVPGSWIGQIQNSSARGEPMAGIINGILSLNQEVPDDLP